MFDAHLRFNSNCMNLHRVQPSCNCSITAVVKLSPGPHNIKVAMTKCPPRALQHCSTAGGRKSGCCSSKTRIGLTLFLLLLSAMKYQYCTNRLKTIIHTVFEFRLKHKTNNQQIRFSTPAHISDTHNLLTFLRRFLTFDLFVYLVSFCFHLFVLPRFSASTSPASGR